MIAPHRKCEGNLIMGYRMALLTMGIVGLVLDLLNRLGLGRTRLMPGSMHTTIELSTLFTMRS